MPTSRAPFVDVVAAVREHTSQLLGRTIGFSDEDWAAPTALPGWTRSHVAAHLVDGARRLVRVIDGLHSGRLRTMYDSDAEERRTIEMGALAGGLDLQIQLDTTASELQELFPSLEGDRSPVLLRPGYGIQAWQIPLSRLGEVVLHEMDLEARSSTMNLAPETAVGRGLRRHPRRPRGPHRGAGTGRGPDRLARARRRLLPSDPLLLLTPPRRVRGAQNCRRPLLPWLACVPSKNSSARWPPSR